MENALAIYGSFKKEIKVLIYRRQYEAKFYQKNFKRSFPA
jgi:hypothetical protein